MVAAVETVGSVDADEADDVVEGAKADKTVGLAEVVVAVEAAVAVEAV